MANTHISKDVARRYQGLEPFVREELDQQIDEEFRRRHPNIAMGRPLQHAQTDKPGVKQWLQIRDELYLKFANGAFQPQPKRVVQKDTMLCWAAGLESWLAVARGINMSQGELVKKYGLQPDGELDLRKITDFDRVAVPLRINWIAVAGSRITYGLLLDRLTTKGHLLVMYKLTPEVSHTVVVYGIGLPADGKSTLTIMNPSADAPFSSVSLQELRHRQLVLIGWKQ